MSLYNNGNQMPFIDNDGNRMVVIINGTKCPGCYMSLNFCDSCLSMPKNSDVTTGLMNFEEFKKSVTTQMPNFQDVLNLD